MGVTPTYNVSPVPRSPFIRWAPVTLVALLTFAWSSFAYAAPLSGVVYEAKTGNPVAGLRVQLYYDATDTLEPGMLVPAQRLAAGEQSQRSARDGSYSFDLPNGRIYRLEVTSIADHFSFPSRIVPPLEFFPPPPFGEIGDSSTPRDRGARPFYLRFDATSPTARFLLNHIAVDKLADVVSLTLEANRSQASIGDVLSFSGNLNNDSPRSFTAAEGRPVFLDFALARGLSINPDSTTAEVQIGDSPPRFTSARGGRVRPSSDRMVRLGPFDVPAGSQLRVRFQATVGIDTKEGRFESRLSSRDPGGVELSNEAVATVAIVKDRDLGTSTLLGRVFCDEDGSSHQDPDESGVFGARIYSDSGTIAISDAAGRFHFTRVQPGSHIFKLDQGSLAGGKVRGSDRRLLRLSEGLPAQLRFPVDCGREWISSAHARVVLPLVPPVDPATQPATQPGPTRPKVESVTLRGRLSPMTLALAGRRLDVPSVELRQELPAALVAQAASPEHGATLLAVPKGGYQTDMPRWRVVWKEKHIGAPLQWRFTIERVEKGGLAPVLHRDGKGAPPPFIEWNGLGDSGNAVAAGAVHVARLTLISTKGVEVASKRQPFGIGSELSPGQVKIFYGDLFKGERASTEATTKVQEEIRSIASRLANQGSVHVEVHGDGSGDRLKSLAQTQVEAKLVQEYFIKAGLPASRVTVRGRGASEPLDDSGTELARRRNRRIVFDAKGVAEQSKSLVPTIVHGKSALRIDGRLTPVQGDGGFETEILRTRTEFVAVDLLASSGRRAAFRVHLAQRSRTQLSVAPVSLRKWEVEGNVTARRLAIDFQNAPESLWSSDVRLTAVGALPIPEIHTELQGSQHRLSSPMDFRLLVPQSLSIKRWQLVVAEDSGIVVHRESKEGPVPAVIRWDGMSNGSFVLRANTRYRYWLDIEASDASGFLSAPHWFEVDPKVSANLLEKRGRFFGKNLSLRAALRNPLSRFAAKQKKRADERSSIVLEVVGDRPRVDRARAALVQYLASLGVKASSYDIEARELVEGRDRIAIVRDSRPARSEASVRINGRRVALHDGAFTESVELARDEPIVVEMTAANGSKLRYIGAEPQPSMTDTVGGELIAPGSMELPEPSVQGLRDDEILASDTPARSLRVHLPSKGVVLGDRELALSGSVDKGTVVKVNGKRVELTSDGSFYVMTTLPLGPSELEIRADDKLGGSSTIRWPVQVARTHHVAVALVEGIATSAFTALGWMADPAAIAGMGRDTTFQVGSLLLSARAQGYVKARVSGGALADTVEITAHIDTGRERDSSAFFEQVVDPNRSHPVLGDDAAEIQDVNTRGKIYARVRAGDSSVVVGSVHTRLEGGGELFDYDRTADGALADLRRRAGDNEVAVRAFSTTAAMTSSRDVNWFRATGGSLYYLRHGQVLEGSEKVRIVVRDRDSGLMLSETDLVEGVDYSIDYEGGRIRLTEALSATSRTSWVLDNMDSSATPMGGHHAFLNVRYEHEDQDGLSQSAAGAYASTNLEGRLSVGAGIVSEKRADQETYRLLGADASLNLGETSNLRAEIAASRQRDANHSMSQDGGLSFGGLQLGSAFDGGSGDPLQLGWKLSVDLVARDWTKAKEFRDTTLSAYVQDLDRGFSSGDSALDQGRFKFGGRIQQRLTARDMLLIRHEGQVAQVPRVGPTLADVMANPEPSELDERASYLTSVQWARDEGRWHYKVEGMHQRMSSTASLVDGSAAVDARRIGIGVLTAYEYSKRIALRVGQQIVANTQSADPVVRPIFPMDSSSRGSNSLAGVVTNIGSDLLLTPDLSITADVFQRWNGDNAARLGLRTAVSDRGSMYVQEQVGGIGGRLSNATIIGAEDRFGEDGGGRSYGEYQLNRGVLGNRNRAVLGLGRRWQVTKKLGLGMGFEHQQAFGGYLPDGSAIGDAQRNVLHGSYTVTHRDTFRLTGHLELRLDHGDSGEDVDSDVLGADPRPDQRFGSFSDHGGPLVGAALVIPPGEQVQVLAGMGAEWQIDAAHTWLGRARTSLSSHSQPGKPGPTTLAKFTELSTGLAFRPMKSDRVEFLTRYSYLMEQRPLGLSGSARKERSHVFAVMPYARLPKRFQISGKLAFKHTFTRDIVDLTRQPETGVTAILSLVRLGYRFYGKWDASAEARHLALIGSADDESKLGSLLELGYAVGRYLRLGAGYNLSHFSDDELRDLQRDSHGFFVRVTGQY